MTTSRKDHVELVPLSEAARFIRGITFKPEELVEPGSKGSVVCMRTKNVQEELDQDDLIAVPQDLVRRSEQFLQESDILVSTANSWELVGKCSWVPKLPYPAAAGGFISILRANVERANPRYLYHWFSTPRTQFQVRNCGRQTTNISNMSYERCLALEIPLPPLKEQRRIADVLDEAHSYRRKRQELLGEVDLLPASLFHATFGTKHFPCVKLGNLTSKISSGSTPRGGRNVYLKAGPVMLVRSQNVLMNALDLSDVAYISEDIDRQMRRSVVEQDDVLLNITGASIGRVARFPTSEVRANVNQHVCIIRCDVEKLNPVYLERFLSSPRVQHAIHNQHQHGGTRQALTFAQLSDFEIPLPSIDLQDRYAALVAQADKLASSHSRSLNESEHLFDSLVHHAFLGRL